MTESASRRGRPATGAVRSSFAALARMALLAAGAWSTAVPFLFAQPAGPAGQAPKCVISGAITSGAAQLPGVAVTAVPADGGASLAAAWVRRAGRGLAASATWPTWVGLRA